MMITFKFLLLVLSVFVGYSLGWYLTEKKRIADMHPLFNFEAFQCRQCLSFHITWVTAVAISLLFNDWIMALVGVVFAFMLFLGLHIDAKRKQISVEDFDKINEEKNIDK